mmetsp:Transcript_62192/g.196768  ORF Transcript_62192/g.196768 Transcript_62192/m.196768 type:complete len:228 (+) Transcript_62192:2649-3332(+)
MSSAVGALPALPRTRSFSSSASSRAFSAPSRTKRSLDSTLAARICLSASSLRASSWRLYSARSIMLLDLIRSACSTSRISLNDRSFCTRSPRSSSTWAVSARFSSSSFALAATSSSGSSLHAALAATAAATGSSPFPPPPPQPPSAGLLRPSNLPRVSSSSARADASSAAWPAARASASVRVEASSAARAAARASASSLSLMASSSSPSKTSTCSSALSLSSSTTRT